VSRRDCPGNWRKLAGGDRRVSICCGLPIKFIGLGEQSEDLQPFDAKQCTQALFEE
jgi:signal recognition particle GTPase